jgi:hypothetical protein
MTPWTRTGLKFVVVYVIYEIVLILATVSGLTGLDKLAAWVLFFSCIPGGLVLQLFLPLMTDNPIGTGVMQILSTVVNGVLIFAIGFFIGIRLSKKKVIKAQQPHQPDAE